MNKNIIKTVWIAVFAVVIFCVLALILTNAIKENQREQNEQIAIKEYKTEGIFETTAVENTEETESAANKATEAENEHTDKPSVYEAKGYTIENNVGDIMPKENVEEIAAKIADQIARIYDDTLENCKVIITYNESSDSESGDEHVVNVAHEGELKYFCATDADGNICFVNNLGFDYQKEETATLDMKEYLKTDTGYLEKIKALVEDKLADGRKVVEVFPTRLYESVEQAKIVYSVVCKVKMGKGECYEFMISYPSCEIIGFTTYPLGWQSCVLGYQTELQKNRMEESMGTTDISKELWEKEWERTSEIDNKPAVLEE